MSEAAGDFPAVSEGSGSASRSPVCLGREQGDDTAG